MSEGEGFAYDSLRDDYILIRTVQHPDKGGGYIDDGEDYPRDSFETYYPNGQLRRRIADYLFIEGTWHRIGFAIYLNGTCHWRSVLTGTYNYKEGTYTYVDTLFSVDIGSNKLTTTRISEGEYKDIDDHLLDINRKLVALNSYVSTISMCRKTKCIDISILGEVGGNESWVKLFTIRPLSSIEGIMGIGLKGDLLLSKNDDELVSFDLGTQKIQEIGIKGSRRSETLIYEKSFLPIGRVTN
ncbi:hypothetical protein PIB30_064293 [Stylosanthes scabra]|uniref:F-box associated domain-containing protein n=1 Tax=Stylosanthes scabra TaxID=79078 RepID=A0ABU6WJZ0_9FABA|nr:hypothetical protein [Stylosanthes scabra]